MLMYIKRLVRFCELVLKILSGNEILTSIKNRNSVKIWQKITDNNLKVDLVNVDAHKMIGKILSIIERKQNSDIIQRPLLHQIWQKMTGNKILSMLMCIQNLVRVCLFVLKILSGNEILMSIEGRNFVKILRKMTGNNPKLDDCQC